LEKIADFTFLIFSLLPSGRWILSSHSWICMVFMLAANSPCQAGSIQILMYDHFALRRDSDKEKRFVERVESASSAVLDVRRAPKCTLPLQ
jgi:hypothetical protein